MVEKGKIVSVHYKGTIKDGEVFDDSNDREPLQFEIGQGKIIPGFEKAILGKKEGDKIDIKINPEDAYGEKREDLVVEVEKSKMPQEVEVGQTLEANSDDGKSVNVTVKEVNDNNVVVDGNHPLAGEELFFNIEIVEVKDSQETETK